MLHRHHYYNNCDDNFCKVSDIYKHFSTTIVDNRNRKLNCKKKLCVKNPVFYQIDKKITITFVVLAKAEYCSSRSSRFFITFITLLF